MFKEEALQLLGGSVAEAARWIGVADQAIRGWPVELSRVQADRVEAALARKRALESRELSPLSKGLLRQLAGQDAAADQISLAAAQKMFEDLVNQAAMLAAERVVIAFTGMASNARTAVAASTVEVEVPKPARRARDPRARAIAGAAASA